jgi:hypothetical protein
MSRIAGVAVLVGDDIVGVVLWSVVACVVASGSSVSSIGAVSGVVSAFSSGVDRESVGCCRLVEMGVSAGPVLREATVIFGSLTVVAAAISSSVALGEPDRYVTNMTARPSRIAASNNMAPFRFWELHASLFSSVKMFLVPSL